MSVLVLASTWNPIVLSVVTLLFVAVSLLLILTVLIQKPQGGGLSGAFGAGAGSGQTAFGAKTGDALTVITILMFVAWLAVAVAMNYGTKPADRTRATEARSTQNGDQTGTSSGGAAPTEGAATPAPATNAPETTAPDTKAPNTTAPDTNAPETKAPEVPASVPAPAPAPAQGPAPANPGSNPK